MWWRKRAGFVSFSLPKPAEVVEIGHKLVMNRDFKKVWISLIPEFCTEFRILLTVFWIRFCEWRIRRRVHEINNLNWPEATKKPTPHTKSWLIIPFFGIYGMCGKLDSQAKQLNNSIKCLKRSKSLSRLWWVNCRLKAQCSPTGRTLENLEAKAGDFTATLNQVDRHM